MITEHEMEKLFGEIKEPALRIAKVLGRRYVYMDFYNGQITMKLHEDISNDTFSATTLKYAPPVPEQLEVERKVHTRGEVRSELS